MNKILNDIVSVIIALIITFIVKKIADFRTKDIDDDHEIEENSNFAVGARRAGLYLGGMIVMSSVFLGTSNGLLNDMVDLVVYGILGYILLFFARMLTDGIILHGIKNDAACKEQNSAVGLVEMGIYISSALIISASIMGDSTPVLESSMNVLCNDFLSIIAFFAIGQAVLIIALKLYELLTPFKWLDEIKNANASAGVMAAGVSVALGLILRKSIMGPFTGWMTDLKAFGLSALIGIVVLIILIPLIDRLFLPHTTLNTEIKRDKNIAAVLVAQFINIGFALLISTLL